MREVIESLFSNSEDYELYQGVIETVEGIGLAPAYSI